MSVQTVFTSNGRLAYHTGSKSVFRLGAAAAGSATNSANAPAGTATTPVVKGVTGLVAPWGDDNLFPQNVLKAAEINTVIPSVLDWKCRAVYGDGPVFGRVTGYNPDGSEKFERSNEPEVAAFWRQTNVPRYALEMLQNLFWFANGFPELLLNRGRNKIAALSAPDTAFCRYSVPTVKSPVPEWLYISANWDAGAKPGDGFTSQLPVLDPYYGAVDAVRQSSGYHFVYPLSFPSPGKSLYQLASWNSIRRSGWLDVAQAVPEFKKALFKNQLSIKYLIEVHEAYWKWKYPDWDVKEEGARRQIISDELDTFEKTMMGVDGAGKSVLAITITDPSSGQIVQAFKVSAIDDKILSGAYIEDSQEASSHIYTALSVDPTLVGISPGKGMGAGSGSDKSVAFRAFISTHRFYQDLVLEPLYLIRDFNGWPADLEFRFLNPALYNQPAPQHGRPVDSTLTQ